LQLLFIVVFYSQHNNEGKEPSMKNPMAIMAAIAAGFVGILKGVQKAGHELRRDPWGRGKRKVGHNEGIAKMPGYNKAMLRCQTRQGKRRIVPV
jgi:hypothetical protein